MHWWDGMVIYMTTMVIYYIYYYIYIIDHPTGVVLGPQNEAPLDHAGVAAFSLSVTPVTVLRLPCLSCRAHLHLRFLFFPLLSLLFLSAMEVSV